MVSNDDFSCHEGSSSTTTPPAVGETVINYVCFKHSRDTVPKAVSVPWSKFCEKFSRHDSRVHKDGPCWSPASYIPGASRGNRGVETVNLVVLDVDDGTPFDSIRTAIEGKAALLHSSWSHTTSKPKYRVILPLVEPIPAEQWPGVWQRISAYFGGHIDPATKDAARVFYAPSKPIGADDHFVQVLEGALFDTKALPDQQTIRVVTTPKPARDADSDHVQALEELAAVARRCHFMQWASKPTNQPNVSEPLWFAMVSNASRFENDEWVHEASKYHPEYDEAKTDDKIIHSLGTDPITCKYIQAHGFRSCPKGGCTLPSGRATKAPAGLAEWARVAPTLMDQVEAFVQRTFSGHLVFTQQQFRAYQAGFWPVLDEQAEVRRPVLEDLGRHAQPKSIQDYVSLMRDRYSVKDIRADIQDRHLICLRNGTLDPVAGKLLAHSPHHRLTTKVPIIWDEIATCDTWQRCIEQYFEFDIDKEQRISFIQEWFGYCLVPITNQQKFLWLVGSGGNGKSVVLTVLNHLVGLDNVSHVHIESLDDNFTRAQLDGKLLNISSEMSAKATVSDGYLKAIVSGDPISAEHKFRNPFSFIPTVRMVASTNELPRLLDLSEGFFRRAIILVFNRRFDEANQDKHLVQKLLGEMPGILAWSVKGLQRLLGRGHFEIPSSSIAAINQYRCDCDPVRQFVEEELEVDNAGVGLQANVIYGHFERWCETRGYSKMNIGTLGRRLGKLGFEKRKSNGRELWKVRWAQKIAEPSANDAEIHKRYKP